MRALPAPVAARAQAVRRVTAPAPDRAAARPDPEITSVLVQVCAEHRLVRISYRSEAGSEWDTVVQPWAVVVRHGRWYLLCRARGEVRGYRVDRVRAAEAMAETFEPPADLDPVAVLEENLSTGWEYPVELIIAAPRDAVVQVLSPAVGRVDVIDEESCRVVGTTGNPYWCAEQLVGSARPGHHRRIRADPGRRAQAGPPAAGRGRAPDGETGGRVTGQPATVTALIGHRFRGRAVRAAAVGALRGNSGQHVHAAGDRAEDGVGRRQRRVLVDQEELRSVGVRAGVGHRHGAGGIGHARVGLVGEGVAGPTASRAGGVAALQHAQGRRTGQPMARGVV